MPVPRNLPANAAKHTKRNTRPGRTIARGRNIQQEVTEETEASTLSLFPQLPPVQKSGAARRRTLLLAKIPKPNLNRLWPLRRELVEGNI